ncbi:MAG: YkvA family protein [Granulosicoccus sp.]
MTRKLIASVKQWAVTLKRDVHAIWLAGRDSRTPWIAKLIALAVAAYAISPIDLIPDFIPIIGYLDDLIILPLGIVLVIRLIPNPLMAEFRLAALNSSAQPVSRIAAVFIVAVWVVCLAFLISYFFIR